MIEVPLSEVEGVRCVPDSHSGLGVLVLAGSSGRVEAGRARLFAARGALAESIRWFGGAGQSPGPWEVGLELFVDRVADLRRDCDRILLVGTSFGSEAALLTGALSDDVDGVVAFAPSDVVWAGVTPEGRMTSHWTLDGSPLPFVPFAPDWEPSDDPPAYLGLYRRSRELFADEVAAATIPVERIAQVILVAGGDDQVWPATTQAEAIRERRARYGLPTVLVTDDEAGHRAILPGEPEVTGGMSMRRGGNGAADRRLGRASWERIAQLL